MIAAQLWEAADAALPGLDEQIASGELAPLGEWLRANVHTHGRRRTPAQILEAAGCGPLSAQPLMRHLERLVDLQNA